MATEQSISIADAISIYVTEGYDQDDARVLLEQAAELNPGGGITPTDLSEIRLMLADSDDDEAEADAREEPRYPSGAAYAEGHGYELDAVDIVGVAEITERAGVQYQTVQSWRRRHATFPDPLVRLASGPVWDWREVHRWIADHPRRSGRPATRA